MKKEKGGGAFNKETNRKVTPVHPLETPRGRAVGSRVDSRDNSNEAICPRDRPRDCIERLLTFVSTHVTPLWSSVNANLPKRSKKRGLPPASISICMVPLRLKVWRLRMMRAR